MAPTKQLWYFNGFNSAIPEDWSDNQKIVAVEDYAWRGGYDFRPYSVNYRQAARQAGEILAQIPADAAAIVFAGSSMGGWFARIVQLLLARDRPGLAVEALAFNPVFDIGLHGQVLVGPQQNFVTGEHYHWSGQDSARLARLEHSVDYDAPLPFCVYVDQGDEVIDWKLSAARHKDIARFRAFEGGSHSFEHAREALQDFAAAAARLERRRTS